MTFRGILGGLGKTLKWGFVTLTLICGLLLAINAVDEDLSPEVEFLLVLPKINADPSNGYLAVATVTVFLLPDRLLVKQMKMHLDLEGGWDWILSR